MNYYSHIPQITPGLGAAFYSPSEYLNKPPSEFPIGSTIRLISPSLLQQQQQQQQQINITQWLLSNVIGMLTFWNSFPNHYTRYWKRETACSPCQ